MSNTSSCSYTVDSKRMGEEIIAEVGKNILHSSFMYLLYIFIYIKLNLCTPLP